MNVIPFTRKSSLECLSAGRDAAGVTINWLSFFVLGRPFPSAGQSLNAKPATGAESK